MFADQINDRSMNDIFLHPPLRQRCTLKDSSHSKKRNHKESLKFNQDLVEICYTNEPKEILMRLQLAEC